jgi:hypothetical protein
MEDGGQDLHILREGSSRTLRISLVKGGCLKASRFILRMLRMLLLMKLNRSKSAQARQEHPQNLRARLRYHQMQDGAFVGPRLVPFRELLTPIVGKTKKTQCVSVKFDRLCNKVVEQSEP